MEIKHLSILNENCRFEENLFKVKSKKEWLNKYEQEWCLMAEDKKKQKGKMDNPEQYDTDKESLFDKFESERNVDPIPMEDLKQEKREEKDKHGTKNTSSSEEKYKP